MRFNRSGTRFLFTFTLAAAALLAAPVLAQPGPGRAGCRCPHGAHGPGMGLQRMTQHLDLSAEQQEQLEQLRARHREETRSARDRLQAAHERFADLAHAETLDEAALREAAAEMAGLRTEMMVSRAAMMSEMRGILTPEQFEQLQQMQKGPRGRMGGRGHGRGGGFGPHGPHDTADCPRFAQDPDGSDE